jgi:diaminopimelate epimerase
MVINFSKYQGTGNDFILLDNREGKWQGLSMASIRHMCDRHFGIGADGLMLLNKSAEVDFEMKYYNANGNESSMCGNGGRCIAAFARDLGIISHEAHFRAIDGLHIAMLTQNEVELKMNDVQEIIQKDTFIQLNTGSPHYVHFTEYVSEMNVKKEGALIRNSPLFREEGINVNFVEVLDDHTIFVRTYERGVEDETLSCGTGVCASAIAWVKHQLGEQQIQVKTLGGTLGVRCTMQGQDKVSDIWLKGRADFVFSGTIDLAV